MGNSVFESDNSLIGFGHHAAGVEALVVEERTEPMAVTVADVRRAQLAELPSMKDTTRLKPAVEEVNIFLVPLANGAVAEACVMERTKETEVPRLGDRLWQALDSATACGEHGVQLVDMVTVEGSGRSTFAAARAGSLKNKMNGVYVLRVIAHFAEFLIGRVHQAGLAVSSRALKEVSHQVVIPSEYYPAKVIEQVWAQHGLHATVRKVFDTDDEMLYSVFVDSESQGARLVKNGLVLTADNVRFDFHPVMRRTTLETRRLIAAASVT